MESQRFVVLPCRIARCDLRKWANFSSTRRTVCVAFRARPRYTVDLDILVHPTAVNATNWAIFKRKEFPYVEAS